MPSNLSSNLTQKAIIFTVLAENTPIKKVTIKQPLTLFFSYQLNLQNPRLWYHVSFIWQTVQLQWNILSNTWLKHLTLHLTELLMNQLHHMHLMNWNQTETEMKAPINQVDTTVSSWHRKLGLSQGKILTNCEATQR